MKMNFIIKTALILILLLLISLTACSENKSGEYELNSKTPVSLSMWNHYNGAQKTAFDKLVKEFNQTLGREKGIVIEVFSQGSIDNLNDMLRNTTFDRLGNDGLPNLFSGYVETANELDDMGLLSSFDEYFSDEELAHFDPSYIEECRFDKDRSLKIIPIGKSTEVLVLNKTDWDKFSKSTGENIDKLSTWEGIVEVSKKYYDYSDGKAFFGRDVMFNYILVASYQLGHEMFIVENEKKFIDIDKSSMKKVWDNYYIPFVSGHYQKNGKFASDDAKTGDIIAFVASSSSSISFPTNVVLEDEREYPIELLVLPLPNFRGARKIAVQQGIGFMMTKSTKIKEYAGALFLKWLTEDERNLQLSYDISYIPVKTNVIGSNFMSEESIGISNESRENVNKTLVVALEQFNKYELFTCKAIKGSAQVRRYVENSLLERAIEDKRKIEVELGVDGKTTLIKKSIINDSENFILAYSDKSFQLWYDEMLSSLNYLILGK